MRRILQRNQFRRDYKIALRRGKDIEKLHAIVNILAEEGRLDSAYRPHKLSGEYEGWWECNIESNWLLVFDTTREAVILFRTGSHTDLFG